MTSTVFNHAVQFTLDSEGVFSNDPYDSGGKTKWGITEKELKLHQALTGELDGIAIEDLTKEGAIAIYRNNYWKYGSVKSSMIAIKLFDIAVNMGPFAAALIAQKALTFCGVQTHVDGRYGPATESAINELAGRDHKHELMLFKAIVLYQASKYVSIVFGNASQLDFIDGWVTRAGKRPL